MPGDWIDDTHRRDGLEIMLGMVGWVIRPANSRTVMRLCPCCERPFPTLHNARTCAEFEFPLSAETERLSAE